MCRYSTAAKLNNQTNHCKAHARPIVGSKALAVCSQRAGQTTSEEAAGGHQRVDFFKIFPSKPATHVEKVNDFAHAELM